MFRVPILTSCTEKKEGGGGDEYMSKCPHYQNIPYQNAPTFSQNKSSFDDWLFLNSKQEGLRLVGFKISLFVPRI